jgi:hypothetical protein
MFGVAKVPYSMPVRVTVISEANDRQYNNELATGTEISVEYLCWRFHVEYEN